MSQKPNVPESSTVGRLGPAEMAALNTLRSRLMPLVYQLDVMKQEMANSHAPLDWPTIQRSTSTVTHLLTSLHTLLHTDTTTTHLFASLHPYPTSPYPINDPQLFTVALSHLRKMPEPHDVDWVNARIAKAAEFAHVPAEWGVEPAPLKEEDEEEDGGNGGEGKKVKRGRGTLDEDQIVELWADAVGVVEDEMANVGPEAGSEDEDEDEEMEDVVRVGTGAGGAIGTGAAGTDAGGGGTKQKSVFAQPIMPVEALQRFTQTGRAVAPGGL